MRKKVFTYALVVTLSIAGGGLSYCYLANHPQTARANVELTLHASKLPLGALGQAYRFDLGEALQVFGDPTYNGEGVRWRLVAGELPAGLSLLSTGVIVGEPVDKHPEGHSFRVAVTYAGLTVEQTYQLAVQGPPARLDHLHVNGTGAAQLSPDGLTLVVASTGGNIYPAAQSMTCQSSGKWYWEVGVSGGPNTYTGVGITEIEQGNLGIHGTLAHYYDGLVKSAFDAAAQSAPSTRHQAGTYGIALDADQKTVRFYWEGQPLAEPVSYAAYTKSVVCPSVLGQIHGGEPGQSLLLHFNGGHTTFKFAPPEGYTPGLYREVDLKNGA